MVQTQTQVGSQIGVVLESGGWSVVLRGRPVKIIGPIAADSFQLQIGKETPWALVGQGGEEPVARHAGDFFFC